MLRFAAVIVLAASALAAGAQTRDRVSTLPAAEGAAKEPRYALVMGNSAYNHGPLKNPVNDARAMAKALSAAGFNVRLLEDGSQAAMQRVVRLWGDDLAKGGVGLFYYAGHGMQVKGKNYLVPVNAEIDREDEIEFNALDVNQVLAKMDSAKNALNIVILDACRNNPFARSFRVAATGLAQMDAPTGTFIAFATSPGSTASDGTGQNGVYTAHLLREMKVPGLQIEHMFKQVRNGVMKDTHGQQIPWESSSMRGDFAFMPGTAPGVADAVAEALKRDREEQQKNMERMIAVALAQQRAMLEQQGVKLEPVAAATKPVAASPEPQKAPVVAASSAPAVVASAAPIAHVVPAPGGSRLPQAGDTWTYRLTEPKRTEGPKQRNYVVKVSAASESGILDQYSIQDGPSGEWVHSRGAYLVALGASLVSPYFIAFDDLRPGASLGDIQIADPGCFRNNLCEIRGKVVGREVISLPAGNFETFKVRIEQSWRPWAVGTAGGSYGFGGREMFVWYAPAAKRAVKYSSRQTVGRYGPVDSDFTLELVSYQVK